MNLLEIEAQYFDLHPQKSKNVAGQSLGSAARVLEDATLAMNKRDWIVAGPRGQVVAALRGCNISNIDNGAKSYKVAPSSNSASNRALQAVGLALSSQRAVLCFLGAPALGQGGLFEALNIAGLQQLPIVFVIVSPNLSKMPLSHQVHSIVDVANSFQCEAMNIEKSEVTAKIQAFQKDPKPTVLNITL